MESFVIEALFFIDVSRLRNSITLPVRRGSPMEIDGHVMREMIDREPMSKGARHGQSSLSTIHIDFNGSLAHLFE